MKIAVMGSGGVGGLYGARLARGGAEVAFIARGAHLAAMRERGLRVESAMLGDFSVERVTATDDPAEVGPVDLVWMTVKSYDLEPAAEAIRPLIGAETLVVPLLNGVDSAERIGAIIGREHMLGGIVQVSASIAEPGVIRHNAMDRLVFGELPGGLSPRATAVHEGLAAAGLACELSPDIRKEIWLKYLLLNTFSGVACLTRMTMGPVLAEPETRALFVAVLKEVEALARAEGVKLEPDISETMLANADNLPPTVKPSMLLDLERGRRIELAAFQGTAMALGRKHGVPTPANDLIHAALALHAEGAP